MQKIKEYIILLKKINVIAFFYLNYFCPNVIRTDNSKIIFDCCMLLFDKFYKDSPIRKVGVSVGNLSDKNSLQLNLFENFEEVKKEETKEKVIDEINDRFGKNSLLKASSLLQDSTIRERKKKIGGHNA